jgi:hypothetical protein
LPAQGFFAPSTEVPFFRHFSVMAGGIKTYNPPLRKTLFAGPRWANTGPVLSVLLSTKVSR